MENEENKETSLETSNAYDSDSCDTAIEDKNLQLNLIAPTEIEAACQSNQSASEGNEATCQSDQGSPTGIEDSCQNNQSASIDATCQSNQSDPMCTEATSHVNPIGCLENNNNCQNVKSACEVNERYEPDAVSDNVELANHNPLFICETCKDVESDDNIPATWSCKDCKELYCDSCSGVHRKQKATKNHAIVKHEDLESKLYCDSCQEDEISSKIAEFLCIDCDETQCADCNKVHMKQKATRNHTIVCSTFSTNQYCIPGGITKEQGIPASDKILRGSTAFTLSLSEKTRHQNAVDIETAKIQSNEMHADGGMKPILSDDCKNSSEKRNNIKGGEKLPFQDKSQPGKPSVAGNILIDSVCLVWDAPRALFEAHAYQVRFKEVTSSAKWAFHPDLTPSCSITFNNLKSDSKYVFQVRMVNDETEGPYSEISEPVETIQSAAHHLMDFMYDVERSDVGMPLKRLPLQENLKARNDKGKTRKLVIGNAKKTHCNERTIMLVGATGTGKSTLVDGMINYILGVNWNDPYRLTLVDLEDDERNIISNQAVSQTQWITCYTINPLKGSRLDYTLNIIDTPGFGDTRGIDRDREIIEQIRTLFSRDDETGLLYIDAICFLIKAPDARLTPTQMYIFNAIMSLFGQDIEDNFCMLVTFADGKRPPVLSALKEAKLPHEQYFPFNNSGLFAENSGENASSFSPMFWDMGCHSFQMFFNKLVQLETKSLRQTRDVLEQRQIIELTMENLLPKLDAGLNKVEELRIEIRILEDNKTQIEANSDFTYTVTETEQRQIDLPKGKHVTNCLNCHVTCHKDCGIPNDEDKKGCWAMNSEGFCTQCTGGCFWNIHRNTPYIFEYVSVPKQKTYTEKLKKYRRAQNETMTRQKVVERMHEEVFDLEDDILDLMEKINNCNNILRQIALRPDPLSVVEHIDLLIESERLEKRAGFQNRIASLQQCRKRATVGDDVDRFRTSFTNTTKIYTAHVNLPQKPRQRQRRGPFNFFRPVLNYFQK